MESKPTAPQTQPKTNTDSNSKPPLWDCALAEPLPPDHWIYPQGARFGFVGALPKSLTDITQRTENAGQVKTRLKS
jgi:hypothetical protein